MSATARLATGLALAAFVSVATTVGAQTAPTPRGEVMLEQSFDVGPGGQLEISVSDADIQVLTGDGSGVDVRVYVWSTDEEYARERFVQMEMEASQVGQRIQIRARDPSRAFRRRRGASFNIVTVVSIPRRFDVDIETDDGDVWVGDLEGTLRTVTSDGDIELGTVAGALADLETSDGDVAADALDTDRATIRSSDGDIVLGRAMGDLDASTSDGDIRVRLATFTEVRLESSDGDITILVPSSAAASLDLDGEDLRVDQAFTVTGRISRGRVRGDMNGGGARLIASTNDGSISLQPN